MCGRALSNPYRISPLSRTALDRGTKDGVVVQPSVDGSDGYASGCFAPLKVYDVKEIEQCSECT